MKLSIGVLWKSYGINFNFVQFGAVGHTVYKGLHESLSALPIFNDCFG